MDFSWEIIVAIIIAITIHEFCHAWVANWLGDPTARLEGRLSINPLVHLDPIGTLMMFLVHFGWGKPVPYNPRYLSNPRLGGLLISLAGPLSNFVQALIFAIPLKYLSETNPMANFFFWAVLINLGLFVFNLLPIPPLDGSKVLAYFIPVRFERQLEQYMQYGPILLISIILLERITHIPIISPIIVGAIQKLALLIGLST